MTNVITQKINDYDNAKARVEYLRLKKKELIDSVIPDDVKDDIKGIEIEFDPDIQDAEEYASQLETEVKDLVVEHGESVEGEHMKVIYYKGRDKWDTTKLEGVAVIYPDILKCKSTGNPYAVIKNK